MAKKTLTDTPAPWSVFDEDCIVDATGHHVVCAGHDYDEGGIITSAAVANLIAAAPDLLAALKGALDALEYVQRVSPALSGYGVRHDCTVTAKAAIAKAEGQ